MGPSMVRVVLFDIDGTLIRTGGAGVRAFARVAEEVYGRPGGTAGLSFHGATDSGLVRDFLRTHGVADTPDERRRFLSAYLFWLDHHLSTSAGEICPGVLGFMEDLRGMPQPPMLGLLTGNVRRGAELKLRAHRLWDEFQVGAYGDDHEDRAELARRARQRAEEAIGERLRGAEILVIGDTPADVACSRAIGARCLAVATGGIQQTDLQACEPDWCVPDLGAVSVAEVCA